MTTSAEVDASNPDALDAWIDNFGSLQLDGDKQRTGHDADYEWPNLDEKPHRIIDKTIVDTWTTCDQLPPGDGGCLGLPPGPCYGTEPRGMTSSATQAKREARGRALVLAAGGLDDATSGVDPDEAFLLRLIRAIFKAEPADSESTLRRLSNGLDVSQGDWAVTFKAGIDAERSSLMANGASL